MAISDNKITNAEIAEVHVQAAPDTLTGSAQQNKAVFDAYSDLIAGKFNDLIDEIVGPHGDEIKVAVDEWLAEHPEATTTVQDNSLTTAKYVDGSVTEPKIAEGAVTPSKLDRAYTTPGELTEVNNALTNEINVLDARMDEFASLPDGSTAGNAELLDIRVGANGGTYQSAGAAVRGQVADLKSALNTFFEIQEVHPTIINDEYYYVSGSQASISTGVGYSRTAPIQVVKGQTIKVTARGLQTGIIGIVVLCDENGANLKPAVASDSSSVKDYYYEVEEDGYIACSYVTSSGCVIYVGYDYKKIVGNVNDTFQNDFYIKQITPSSTLNSYFYVSGSTATLSTGIGWSYTEPIPVIKGQTIKVTARGVATGIIGIIVLCDENGANLRPAVASDSSSVKDYYYEVKEDGYIACSYATSSGIIINSLFHYYTHAGRILTLEELVGVEYSTYSGKEICVFDNILCVGDSLTSGVFNYNSGGDTTYVEIPKYSYPTQLTKMYGVDTTNKGHGGLSTKGWYEVEQNNDLSGHDAAIIALGTNDSTRITSAETSQYLQLIVDKLKNDNNGIRIFICSLLPCVYNYDPETWEPYNTAIKSVANNTSNTNTYLLDMTNHSDLQRNTPYVNGHLTAIGYRKEAQELASYISWIIKNNLALFNDVQFINYGP